MMIFGAGSCKRAFEDHSSRLIRPYGSYYAGHLLLYRNFRGVDILPSKVEDDESSSLRPPTRGL